MKFEKFGRIIEYSREHRAEMDKVLRRFYGAVNMDSEREMLKLAEIVRPYCREKFCFLVHVPFSDKEIGACCYRGDAFGYVFVNTSVPKANENFALAHELYHIHEGKKSFGHRLELYMDDGYNDSEEEIKANIFAGMLLMPSESFAEMFRKFKSENEEGDTCLTLIARLMSYFEVPYMSVVIRCYELGLLEEDSELVKWLLEMEREKIAAEFNRKWLDETILLPSKRDDYPRFREMISREGESLVERGIYSKRQVEMILESMQEFYEEIRG